MSQGQKNFFAPRFDLSCQITRTADIYYSKKKLNLPTLGDTVQLPPLPRYGLLCPAPPPPVADAPTLPQMPLLPTPPSTLPSCCDGVEGSGEGISSGVAGAAGWGRLRQGQGGEGRRGICGGGGEEQVEEE